MQHAGPFPTLAAGGFSAYIDFVAYEETPYTALVHALSLFGHKTAVDAVRARLRMGESVTLSLSSDTTARLVVPETFVSHTRRAGEVTHATLLRDPRTLTTSDFLVLVREGEEPARRFHRLCDGLVTTPLLPHWALWLWRWAQQHESVRELHGIGCRAWLGRLDETQLEQALTKALQTGILTIPVPTVQDT